MRKEHRVVNFRVVRELINLFIEGIFCGAFAVVIVILFVNLNTLGIY